MGNLISLLGNAPLWRVNPRIAANKTPFTVGTHIHLCFLGGIFECFHLSCIRQHMQLFATFAPKKLQNFSLEQSVVCE